MLRHLNKFAPLPILFSNKTFCDYDKQKMEKYKYKLIRGEEFKK